jgi:hypothetical protein
MTTKCARTICTNTEDVTWFNVSTQTFYCKECAERINKANGEICFQLPPVSLPEGWEYAGFYSPTTNECFLNANDLAKGRVFIMMPPAATFLDPEIKETRRWIVRQK